MYSPLSNFSNSISETYRYTGNKNFNAGTYDIDVNYATLNNVIYSGSFGLLTIGEMFSRNDLKPLSNYFYKYVNEDS